MIAAGVRFGCVLADAGYGLSAPSPGGGTRHGAQSGRAVGIPRHLKVYPVGVRLMRGRPRQRHVPEHSIDGSRRYARDARRQNISCAPARRGKLKARFAAVRVRTADGPPQRIRDKGQNTAGGRGLAHW